MVKTEFFCNTCGERVRDHDGSAVMPFFGFLVESRDGTDSRLRVVKPEETPKHVCCYCLAAFSAMHVRMGCDKLSPATRVSPAPTAGT